MGRGTAVLIVAGLASAVACIGGTVQKAAAQASDVPQPPAPPWESSHGTDHPLVGRIWQRQNDTYIDPEKLAASLAEAPYVVVGEKHDNPDHHRLEAWIVAALVAQGRRPAVALEMFTLDQQPAIDAFLRENPGETAGLGDAVDWSRRGWPAWEQYQPISQRAVEAGLPLIAADLPRETIKQVGREGMSALDEADVARLGLDRPLPEDSRAAMRAELIKSHCNMLSAELAETMVDMQRAREATMASRLVAAAREPKTDGAVLVTGFGHARTDLGVPRHLEDMAAGKRTASVALIEVQEDKREPDAYGEIFGTAEPPFDFVWFVPRFDDEDPCSKYQQQLERLRAPASKP